MTPTTHPSAVPESQPSPGAGEPIVARAGRYYRNTRYLFVAGMLIMGAYFARDGWIKYPREQAMNHQDPKTGVPHSDMDILLQKALACVLPPLGLIFLGWTLYNSRGAYRLRGDVLSVPGHPDVPMDAVRALDKSLWDRKGIAYVDYEVAGRQGRLKLDDFVYDRPPTDQIVERIQSFVAPPAEGFEVATGAAPSDATADAE